MPIYDFRCSACGAEFDQLVRPSDEPACPWCASTALERKMSASAVAVHGSSRSTSSLPMPGGGGGGCCGGSCGCH